MDLAGGATRGCVRAHERARARMPRMPRCRRALFAAVRTDARTRCHHADTFLKAREWKNKISYAERRQVARVVGRQYRSASPGGSTVSERRRALQVGWADWRLSTTGGLDWRDWQLNTTGGLDWLDWQLNTTGGLDWLDWQLNTTGGLGWLTAEHYRRAGLTDSWTLQAGWADWQLNTTGGLGWLTAECYRRAGLTNSWTLQVDLLDRQLSTTCVLGWLDWQLTAEHYRWAGRPWLTAEHYRRADLTDSRALQAGWTWLDWQPRAAGGLGWLDWQPRAAGWLGQLLHAAAPTPLSLRPWFCSPVSTLLAMRPSLSLYAPGPAPLALHLCTPISTPLAMCPSLCPWSLCAPVSRSLHPWPCAPAPPCPSAPVSTPLCAPASAPRPIARRAPCRAAAAVQAAAQYRPQPRRLLAMMTSVTASNTNWMLFVSVAHVWWQ